jgi:DNA-binding transcriptional LysR family regulator
MLDVRRLQALHAVARHGSISAAARALHFTAPAVSQQLSALERETGAALLNRTGRSVELTAAGRLLAAHADVVLDQLAIAEAALDATVQASGTVRLGAFPTAIATVVATAAGALAASDPLVDLRVHEAEPDRVDELWRKGAIDVAVVHHYDFVPRRSVDRTLTQPLFDETMLLALSSDHPLAERQSIELHTLKAERWIVPCLGNACYELVQRACGAARFVPDVVAQCTDHRAMLSLVGSGLGIALVPPLAIDNAPRGVALRALADPIRRYVHLQSHVHPTAACSAVIDALVSAAARHSGG